jgi:hypothetical protein
MGETILRILLGELSAVRVTCPDCKTAVEVLIAKLGSLDRASCGGCGRRWVSVPGHDTHFGNLKIALQGLADANVKCAIEFPLRIDETKPHAP